MARSLFSSLLALMGLVLAACTAAPAAGPTSMAATQGTDRSAAQSASGAAPANSARSGGILRFGQSASDVGTLDPDYASGTQDRALVDMVLNALVRFKPGDSTQFDPDLATALPQPTTEAGKQVWTFSLRVGVMCHPIDGVPAYELTSDDVVYSLQKAANKNSSAYAGDYAGMTFAAPNPTTVTVTLDKPLSSALFYPRVANYSGGYVMCRKPAEKLGADGIKTHPVGTGPFMYKAYSPKEKLDLVANETYFRGKPQLDGVEYRFMADLSSRELGLRGGQLDVINGVADGKWVDQIASAPNARVDIFGVGEVSTIYFNTSKPPFDKPSARQAIAYALSRDEFGALYGPSVASKVFSPVPPQFMAGGMTEAEVTAQNIAYKTDLDKARALLKEAGLENLSFSVVSSEMPSYRVIYESAQAQLAKIGVKMDVKVVDHATMHDQIRKDVNPLVVYVAFRPTPDTYLTQFFHSDAIVVTGKNPNTNFAHYDKIDALIDGARNAADAEAQAKMWKDAQVRALQDMVAYPIQYTNQVYARTDKVDYGHDLKSVIQLYPGIDETTRLSK
ncbi:MAG: ABC transporter substrate-binding protein [Chloroflexota bacterium]